LTSGCSPAQFAEAMQAMAAVPANACVMKETRRFMMAGALERESNGAPRARRDGCDRLHDRSTTIKIPNDRA
jgi:hypothetical protein